MIATIFTAIVTLAGIVLSVPLCVLCFCKKNLSLEKDDQVNYTRGNLVLNMYLLLCLQIDVQVNRAYSSISELLLQNKNLYSLITWLHTHLIQNCSIMKEQ